MMASGNPVKEYTHKHWHVHAIWLIAVLLLVNAWNLINLPSGAILKEYIAFAASLASLLLAIVAIFYSFVNNRDFNISLNRFAGSSERTEQAATNVLVTTERLSGLVETVRSDFRDIQPRVVAMSDRVEKLHTILESGADQPAEGVDIDTGPEVLSIGRISNGGTISLYLLWKGAASGKFFDVREVFADEPAWQGYCAGYLGAIESLRVLDIQIVSDSGKFAVKNLGRLDSEVISNLIEERGLNQKIIQTQIAAIDTYFELEAEGTSSG